MCRTVPAGPRPGQSGMSQSSTIRFDQVFDASTIRQRICPGFKSFPRPHGPTCTNAAPPAPSGRIDVSQSADGRVEGTCGALGTGRVRTATGELGINRDGGASGNRVAYRPERSDDLPVAGDLDRGGEVNGLVEELRARLRRAAGRQVRQLGAGKWQSCQRGDGHRPLLVVEEEQRAVGRGQSTALPAPPRRRHRALTCHRSGRIGRGACCTGC